MVGALYKIVQLKSNPQKRTNRGRMAAGFTLEAAAQEVYSMCRVEITKPDQSVVRKGPDIESIKNKLMREALKIVRLYEWIFLEVTGTVTTVANTYEYTLTPEGASAPEADAVLDVLFDVDATQYKKGIPLDHLDWALARTDPTFNPVAATLGKRYTVKGKSDTGTPIIQLEWIPEAGKVIDFRYKIKVNPADPTERFLPELWEYVINMALAQFQPFSSEKQEYKQSAKAALGAARAYAVRKANDVVHDTLDAETKEQNAFLNSMVCDNGTGYYL